jgi:hypothetical protein
MLYWDLRGYDDEPGCLPFVCVWCGSTVPISYQASPCCSDACSHDWWAWRESRVQPPEPLADGDFLPF